MEYKSITDIIYKNSTDNSEGVVISFEKIHEVISLLEEFPYSKNTSSVLNKKQKKFLKTLGKNKRAKWKKIFKNPRLIEKTFFISKWEMLEPKPKKY